MQPRGSRKRYLELHGHWMGIVVSYNRCALTYGQDKLIAIAGMAEQMH
jgi:hypothetical protein